MHHGNRWALGLTVAAALLAPTASGQIQFTDVSSTSGLSDTETITNNFHGLGVTWFDFDGDGWSDLFIPNGKGNVKELFRNLGDGTFELANQFLPPLPDVEVMGAVAADYDNDGDVDLYLFCDHELLTDGQGDHPFDGPANMLLKNLRMESGDQLVAPLFEEVSAVAGVDDLADPPLGAYPGHRATIGGWLDADRDGWLDLYVGHWILNEGPGLRGNADRLFRNRRDGTFADRSQTFGLYGPQANPDNLRATLGFLAADFNGDLWPDMYVGHTAGSVEMSRDLLWLGRGDGRFRDATDDSLPGFAHAAWANMGVAAGDVDGDGDLDLYMSDMYREAIDPIETRGNPLFLNHGDGTFTENVALAAGVTAHDSWAVVFFDADHDGDEDLFVGTMTSAVPDENFMYANRGDGTFENVNATAGLTVAGNTRGAAVADYDQDGDLDLAFVDQNQTLRLFRNESVNPGHWLQVVLEGRWSNRDAIGATVWVHAGNERWMRQLFGGTGAHSQNELVAHVGLADTTSVDLVEVHWPSGLVSRLTDVAVDQRITIVERFTAPVDTFKVVAGTHISGDEESLAHSDDGYLRICSKADQPHITLVTETTFPEGPYASCSLHVECASSRNNLPQAVEVFDVLDQAYRVIDTTRARPSDETSVIDLVLNAERFVDPDTGTVRVRLNWNVGDRTTPCAVRLDRLTWDVERAAR